MQRLRFGLLFILLSISLITKANGNYTLKDLEVLHAQKSYKEYLLHALDIRPSLRNKQWEKMTVEMASDYVDQLLKTKVVTKSSFDFIESLNNIPTLKNDDFYQLKRTQYAHAFFLKCLNTECLTQFKEYWRTSKRNPEYDFKFYELIRSRDEDLVQTILPHFTKSNVSQFYCNKKYVIKDLLDLTDAPLRKETIENSSVVVNRYANKLCIESMKEDLIAKLKSPKVENSKKHIIFRLLKSHHLLNTEDEDIFLTLYILQGPIVGEIFNLAWNRLSLLSQDYSRRQKLLRALTQFDLLPGEIFSHPDQKKRDTIVSYIGKHFPEYLDHYVRTCIQYFSGKGNYPLGNPTLECDDLMKAAKKRSWIQDHLKIQYSGSKKL